LTPGEVVLEAKDIRRYYKARGTGASASRGRIRAVDGVSLSIRRGETLGIVGESGCGKSTLARLLMLLVPPTSGEIWFRGERVDGTRGEVLRRYWRQIQMVFQNPFASLNPRRTAWDLVAEPLELNGLYRRGETDRWVDDLMSIVGIDARARSRRPSEFSGGQRQRIAIARALVLRPEIVVLDEPTAALDVSIQAQVLNLLKDLQEELHCSYIFISHDLAVIRQMADRLGVMYLGKIVEEGVAANVLSSPSHPYTIALMSAVPNSDLSERPERKRIVVGGHVGSPTLQTEGCAFRPRCWRCASRCATEEPTLKSTEDGTLVACHFPGRGEEDKAGGTDGSDRLDEVGTRPLRT
jgi:oligopeptide/dipeptide ABC transporter ATP-binding protein